MLAEALNNGQVAEDSRLEWKDEGRWDALWVSAEKRNGKGKGGRVSSPLSTVLEVETEGEGAEVRDVDADGDVVMADTSGKESVTPSPSSSSLSFSSSSSVEPESVSAVDSLKALIGRGKARRQGKSRRKQNKKQDPFFVPGFQAEQESLGLR